ncbi:efflux transporter periplasmic adaptor subunit [Longimonas halophila]|uniref:Efflux transporter periplasmic adaptor subunit n=1 Tax=Longimonas halophila TaxID=1469170 RepID=A0A2H3P1U5_9BACT|nr:efflux RND transporter periplasmic adaptor subunit [Longimonas halophila]PEN07926.1 efflux transporter periplasmic adaptor subunit [Longimonas halophila]
MHEYKSYLLGGGFIVGSLLLAVLLVALRSAPPEDPPSNEAPLVATTPIELRSGALHVRGTGTVRPPREIDLTAEVGGRIVSVSDAFVSGGTFRTGDTLARIDPSDYQSRVRQAQAAVTQRQFEVLQAREEVGVAKEEYERMRQRAADAPEPDSTELGRLLFREPQLRAAEANLESARAQLETAQTNLERTALVAPFDGRIRTTQANLGAYIAPGTPIARLFSTEQAEVVVPLESGRAALIDGLWQTSARQTDQPRTATVTLNYGGNSYTWEGYVDRVEGALDAQTRTVNVAVRVDAPYDTRPDTEADNSPPLAVGSYVTVDIEGRSLDRYYVVPRRAVRNDGTVWTIESDTMLVMRDVEVVQHVDDQAFVTGDLTEGRPVITDDLPVVSDSMTVRRATE